MDRINFIERLKDSLYATDYKAIKHSEGLITDVDYLETKLERQAIRDQINQIEQMTDEQFYETYPEEKDEEFVEQENEEELIWPMLNN